MRSAFERKQPEIFGALAQLGERNTGSVEVSGSIPLGSTKYETAVGLCALSTMSSVLALWR
jgi:hypothetical protein